MEVDLLTQAIELVEKANAGLEPELLSSTHARELMGLYSRIEKLGGFGKVALSRKLDDAMELARVSGTSIGKAKEAVATARVLGKTEELNEAFKHGEISLDQAAEIAKAEESSPGAAAELLDTARTESFHVLKDKARRVKLDAEQHRNLAERQRAARSGRSYADELGMMHIHLSLEPHVGTPIVARAEADAARLAKTAKAEGRLEPFERHLADAYAALMSGNGKGRAKRPELVVLVDYEVARRGYKDVRAGEVCKIPGVGPVAPKVVKDLAHRAFLNAVVYDGKDLRQFKRWSKALPIEISIALELGKPPSFDGVACVDCGHRFRTEFDHVHPRAAGGPTSKPNLDPRCWSCHQAKTERDRKSGKLRPPDP